MGSRRLQAYAAEHTTSKDTRRRIDGGASHPGVPASFANCGATGCVIRAHWQCTTPAGSSALAEPEQKQPPGDARRCSASLLPGS